ncbi:hypothetical protein N7475_007951 [Penicillium sp. IBT 31633x]|nr:hypothetical protein N7475_007951 [Penicillium sp. IBT 31633x]
MDRLPPEILTLIFAEIWDLYPESLRGLNTVNKIFYHTAARFLNKTLTIQFETSEEYDAALTDLLALPTSENWFKHTRQLNIACVHKESYMSNFREMLMDISPFPRNDLNFAPQTERMTEQCIGRLAAPKWRLLVSLLSKLQHLVELNYALRNPFPRSWLKALHQYHPACRLNIHTFCPKSLMSLLDDPCETNLIQSPCLHAIHFIPRCLHTRSPCGRFKSRYTENRVSPAELFKRLMSTAPNLKHVYFGVDMPGFDVSKTVSKQSELDLPISTAAIGQLKSLTLRVWKKGDMLNDASEYTDFTKLQSLDFGHIDSDFVPGAIVSQKLFPNLQSLSIVIGNSLSEHTTQSMFELINPLIYLKIRSYLGPSLIEKILIHHGPTLQELVLLPRTGSGVAPAVMPVGGCPEQVLRYAELCPRLRNLHIETQRQYGTKNEIQLYKAYGRFPSLEILALDMECTLFSVRTNDQEDLNMAEMAGIVFNLTLDPALCLAIWDTIASSQKSGRLRKLQLFPHQRRSQMSLPVHDAVLRVAYSLKRSYLVRRRIFDNHELPTVIEIDPGRYSLTDRLDKPTRRPFWFEALPHVDYAFSTAGDELYPFYPNWRSHWLSLPLQRLAVDLLTNRRKRARDGDSQRETKIPRTISQ